MEEPLFYTLPFIGTRQMKESDSHDATRYPNFGQSEQFAFLANKFSSVCCTLGLQSNAWVVTEPKNTKRSMNLQHSQAHTSNEYKASLFSARFSLQCHLVSKSHCGSTHKIPARSTFTHLTFVQVLRLRSFLVLDAIFFLLYLKCHESGQTWICLLSWYQLCLLKI